MIPDFSLKEELWMPQPLDFISVPHARVMSISVATVIAAIFIVATVRLSSGKSGFVWLIKKYRDSPRGRQKNAADQARYRARQRLLPSQLVRDQGSTPTPSCCSLPELSVPCVQEVVVCHFCRQPASIWLRRHFLRHERDQKTPRRSLRGGVP